MPKDGGNDDNKSTASWGDRPRPKGLGTKHLHFDVERSGYLRESLKGETKTRNLFYDGKYRMEKPPNVVFGETPAEMKGQYLVKLPVNHSCFNTDPATGKKLNSSPMSTSTLKGRQNELAELVMWENDNKHGATLELQKRINKDQLKAKRKLCYEQLRQTDLLINNNTWVREQSLVDPDPLPLEPELPNRRLKSYLRAFPCERSKPKFTTRIAGVGFA
jgi:hypothetical protein